MADSYEELQEGEASHFGIERLPSIDVSRAVREYYQALLVQANYDEAMHKLIPMLYVVDYLKQIASKLRTILAQFPDRMAPRLVHETDEETVHHLLTIEIRNICDALDNLENADKVKREIQEDCATNPVLKGGRVSTSHKGSVDGEDLFTET